jgi:virginiamycin B lyase
VDAGDEHEESRESPIMLRPKLLLIAAAAFLVQPAHASGADRKTQQPGVREVQVPFPSLKPSATFKIGKTADWVLVADDAVWVGGSKPYSVQRIDPTTNKVVAKIRLSGEACSGLAFGFGSVWIPVCGKTPTLARVDVTTNEINAILPFGTAGEEAGITASSDSIWIVPDKKGTLARIDPQSNTVRQRITIPPGSYNPLFSDGMIWITEVDSNLLTVVDASSGEVLTSIPVGPKPRFLTSGDGSIWTLNQGDGTVSRVDTSARKVTATIPVGIPGVGGDICYGANSVWTAKFGIPLTRIDTKANKVSRQWVGRGGDAVRFGHGSIWLTDYHRGLLWRIPFNGNEGNKSERVDPSSDHQSITPVVTEEEPHHHVLFKNEFVEVIRAILLPGESTLFHTHSHDTAGFDLVTSTTTEQLLGKPEGPPSNSHAGVVSADTCTDCPMTHRVHNVGSGPMDVFDVELLQRPAQPSGPAAAPVAAENASARVYNWVLAPGATSALHTHKRPYLIVAATPLHLKMTAPDGQSFTETVKPGDFHWVDSTVTHTLTNEGAVEGQIVEIELK